MRFVGLWETKSRLRSRSKRTSGRIRSEIDNLADTVPGDECAYELCVEAVRVSWYSWTVTTVVVGFECEPD